jgi:hypothetical protein
MRRVVDVIGENGGNADQEPAAIEGSIRSMLIPMTKRQFKKIVRWEGEVSEAEYEKYLFAAGVRVNSLAVVQRSLMQNPQLISELYDIRGGNYIYGNYDRLAALYGGQEIIELLLTYGISTVNRALRLAIFEEAARAGRADIVRHVYEFKRDKVPWDFVGKVCIWESTEHSVLYRAQDTASLEVLRLIAELRRLYPNTTVGKDDAEYWLANCVEAGRLDTVEYAIQLGAHPRGRPGGMGNPRGNIPVEKACMRGHIAIVEYLLAHGAGPEQTIATASQWGRIELVQVLLNAGIPPTGAFSKASAGGYLDVVRSLLDAGVDANETAGSKSPLANAIAMEHTAMFNLLIDRGTDLHADGVAEECVCRAQKDGLESMLLLLQAHGVDIAGTTDHSGGVRQIVICK